MNVPKPNLPIPHLNNTSINQSNYPAVLTNSPVLQCPCITRPALLVFSLFLLLLWSGVAPLPKAFLPWGATVTILGPIPGRHINQFIQDPIQTKEVKWFHLYFFFYLCLCMRVTLYVCVWQQCCSTWSSPQCPQVRTPLLGTSNQGCGLFDSCLKVWTQGNG